MGSAVSVVCYGDSGNKAGEAAKQAVTALEQVISCRSETSLLAALNRDGSGDDPQLCQIVSQALDICRSSDGKYDISLYALTSLWNFDVSEPQPPSSGAVDAALKRTGYSRVAVSEDGVVLDGVMLDLGSLGKGLACDKAIAELAARGVPGIVTVGGSVGVTGKKPDGAAFSVGIRNPLSADSLQCVAFLPLESGFVSTSGSYEKRFESGGKSYHHILDPATGWPVETDLISVSVIAPSGLLSDALSTAAFCLGREGSRALLARYGASAVFVFADGNVVADASLRGVLTPAEGVAIAYD